MPRSWSPGRVRLERGERVGDRLEHLVLDVDERRGLARRVPRLGDDDREHVADVARRLALGDELRPVLRDRAPATRSPGTSRGEQDRTTPGMRLGAARRRVRTTRARG